MQREFHVADRESAEVEDAGGQHGVRLAVADGLDERLERPAAARGDDGNGNPCVSFPDSSAVSKPARVPSRSWEVTSSSPAPRRTASSAQATASMPRIVAAAAHQHRPAVALAPGVDGANDVGRAQFAGHGFQQRRIGDGRRIDRHFVGPGVQQRLRVLRRRGLRRRW